MKLADHSILGCTMSTIGLVPRYAQVHEKADSICSHDKHWIPAASQQVSKEVSSLAAWACRNLVCAFLGLVHL